MFNDLKPIWECVKISCLWNVLLIYGIPRPDWLYFGVEINVTIGRGKWRQIGSWNVFYRYRNCRANWRLRNVPIIHVYYFDKNHTKKEPGEPSLRNEIVLYAVCILEATRMTIVYFYQKEVESWNVQFEHFLIILGKNIYHIQIQRKILL